MCLADAGSGLRQGLGAMRGDQEAVSRKFAHNFAEARDWEGLTQAELAERASMPVREIVPLEQAQRCPG